jgi:hypothetical protein
MAFKSVKIVGDGNAQVAITNSNNAESVIHGLLAYNLGDVDKAFTILLGTGTILTETITAGSSYTLPIKLNVPVDTTLSINAAENVEVNISYYQQLIDTAAGLSTVEAYVQTSQQILQETQQVQADIDVVAVSVKESEVLVKNVLVETTTLVESTIENNTTTVLNVESLIEDSNTAVKAQLDTITLLRNEVETLRDSAAAIAGGNIIDDTSKSELFVVSSQYTKHRFARLSILGF